jgi:hypothetical protein
MDAFWRIGERDLRTAVRGNDTLDSMLKVSTAPLGARSAASSVWLEKFYSDVSAQPAKTLCVRIRSLGDVMAFHCIDVPADEIQHVELHCTSSTRARSVTHLESIQELSFFFLKHALYDYCAVRISMVVVHLRPGNERRQCTMMWRCYYVDRVAHEKMLGPAYHQLELPVPVTRDLVLYKGRVEKRVMAKL